jgi:pimeloyl-ACP methyl ester carboxylesterase
MAQTSLKQNISFVTAPDGARIARATLGRGPVIVRAAHWLTHISKDPESPVWRHWLAALSASNTLLRYDLRGCGLSEREVSDISFEAWLADLEAVTADLDAPFALLGMSQGGALSIAYAARHPERVSHLVLIGAYAQGLLVRNPTPKGALEADTLANLMRLGWGKGHPAFGNVFTNLFIPGGSAEQAGWWRRLERETASPEVAARTLDVLHGIDVLDLARQVTVPTLVAHARGDARVPFEQGMALASAIPGARFLPLESDNHVLLEDEPAWPVLRDALADFLPRAEPLLANPVQDFALTAAEADVLDLVLRGLGNREIAARLGKSEKTVRNQVSILLDKTGVGSRAELIVQHLSRNPGQ